MVLPSWATAACCAPNLSILHTSVANATFFATTAPIWVVLFGWLLFRQTVTGGVVAGLLLCLIGGAALLAQSLELRPGGALGDAFGIATGVFYGFYILAVQAARKTASAARLTFEAALITAAILFVVAFIAERSMLPHTIDEFGIAAYSEARRREATSNAVALAWSDVALAVARKAGSLLDQDTSIRVATGAIFAPEGNPPPAPTQCLRRQTNPTAPAPRHRMPTSALR